MKKSILFFIICTPFLAIAMTPEEGIQRLMEGNARYVSGEMHAPRRDEERRQETLKVQNPFAIIVTCSDSRVAPEIVFDEGIGDLFVVRDAGNVIAAIEKESVEYSAGILNSSVVLVMGHKNCGAVNAVLNGQLKGISTIAKLIEPAVLKAKKECSDDCLKLAIKFNALNMKRALMQSPLLKRLVQEDTLIIRAAYFDLNLGTVELLD